MGFALPVASWLIALCFFAAAILYASVGHAGASGYLAVMGLAGFGPEVMRPTALVLNILVATVASIKFVRAGYFSWSLFWPFAIASAPAAYLGGRLALPSPTYRILVGSVLLLAAWRMYRSARRLPIVEQAAAPHLAVALAAGGGLGLLAGLTGVGGGIFLSPLLLTMGWATTRVTSGVAALFILVNSVAGLLGVVGSVAEVPPAIILWVPAVLLGGWVGADIGSRRLASPVLRLLLALVLLVASLKLSLL